MTSPIQKLLQRTKQNSEKIIVIYTIDINNVKVYNYKNEKKESIIQKEEFDKEKRLVNYGEYAFINFNKRFNLSMEHQYNKFVKDAKEIKIASNGTINPLKNGKAVICAQRFFYECLFKNDPDYEKLITNPEHISYKESQFISGASVGPIVACDKYEGECYKYDIKSSYPSQMQSEFLKIPMRCGKFKKLTNDEFHKLKYFPVCICRCVIEDDEDDDKMKYLFKFNKKNYYTQIDLNRAKELNLKITLIEDGEDNMLEYDRKDCVTASELFRDYVKYIYDLKEKLKGNDLIKEILNCLWGLLTSSNECTVRVKNDERLEMYEDRELGAFVDFGDYIEVKIKYTNHIFEHNYARLKPFLLAKTRTLISKYIEPHKKYVVRCHTDSMFSTKKIDFGNNNNIGSMRYEGYTKDCIIENVMKFSPKNKDDWII